MNFPEKNLAINIAKSIPIFVESKFIIVVFLLTLSHHIVCHLVTLELAADAMGTEEYGLMSLSLT